MCERADLPPPELQALRRELKAITENFNVGDQRDQIQRLSQNYAHTIEVVDWPGNLKECTCGVYALGFHDWKHYPAYAERGPFAGCDFFCWLLREDHLHRISMNHVVPGSLVMYFDELGPNLTWKHVGRLISQDRVESKWGVGWVYRHSIWEVPIQYGWVVEYFSPISTNEAQDLFEQYIREEWSPSVMAGLDPAIQ